LDEVAVKTGFSKPYLSTVETGRVTNPPSDNLLRKLEAVLDFEAGLLQHIAHVERMPADVRRDYEAIDAQNRRYRQLIKDFIEQKTDTKEIKDILDTEELDIESQPARLKPGQLVRVVGDSMEPKFCEGDIVVFSPVVEVSNGDDCFVRFTQPHETTFKRVFFEADDKVRLQPRNQKYPPMIINGKRINGLYRAVIKYERL
jgi:repressor LexA